MASTLGSAFGDAGKARRKAAEKTDYGRLFREGLFTAGVKAGAESLFKPIAEGTTAAVESVLVSPFQRKATLVANEPNMRALSLTEKRNAQLRKTQTTNDMAAAKNNVPKERVAFNENINDDVRSSYIEELAKQAKMSSNSVEGITGLGFSIDTLKKDNTLIDQMIYQSWKKSGYLDVLVEERKNFQEIYDSKIPTGQRKTDIFEVLEAPKNLGSWIGRKTKNIFTGTDPIAERANALDGIAENNEELKPKYKAIGEIVETFRSLDESVLTSVQTLADIEKNIIFQNDYLVKEFNKVGTTGKKEETIQEIDGVLYTKTQVTITDVNGTRELTPKLTKLTDETDLDGRLVAAQYQSNTKSNIYNFATGALSKAGLEEFHKIIEGDLGVYSSSDGRPLNPAGFDMTLDQYENLQRTIQALARDSKYVKESPEITVARMEGVLSIIKSQKEDLATLGTKYQISDNSSWMFQKNKPSELLNQDELLELVIPDETTRKEFKTNGMGNRKTVMQFKKINNKDQADLFLFNLQLQREKESASMSLAATTAGFLQTIDKNESIFDTTNKEEQEITQKRVEDIANFSTRPTSVDYKSLLDPVDQSLPSLLFKNP